jgi:predicted nucleic acid-binding protein
VAQLASFEKVLKKAKSVYIDTNVFIYHLEASPLYSPLTEVFFDLVEDAKVNACTSTLSLLELNVKPYRSNQSPRALIHIALLKNLPNLSIKDMTIEIADRAAQLRAKNGLKTPDAIHLASALNAECDLLLGNDADLKKTKSIQCLRLDDFI